MSLLAPVRIDSPAGRRLSEAWARALVRPCPACRQQRRLVRCERDTDGEYLACDCTDPGVDLAARVRAAEGTVCRCGVRRRALAYTVGAVTVRVLVCGPGCWPCHRDLLAELARLAAATPGPVG